jgi:hypothetical protein
MFYHLISAILIYTNLVKKDLKHLNFPLNLLYQINTYKLIIIIIIINYDIQ